MDIYISRSDVYKLIAVMRNKDARAEDRLSAASTIIDIGYPQEYRELLQFIDKLPERYRTNAPSCYTEARPFLDAIKDACKNSIPVIVKEFRRLLHEATLRDLNDDEAEEFDKWRLLILRSFAMRDWLYGTEECPILDKLSPRIIRIRGRYVTCGNPNGRSGKKCGELTQKLVNNWLR